MATETTAAPSLLPLLREGKPDAAGWLHRRIAMGAISLLVLALPHTGILEPGWVTLGAVYVIVGLSLNILIGYAGQVSLGHQAFVGIGAFASALMTTNMKMPFFMGIALAIVSGAVAALLLGFVALRLKGLYLALITLAYGLITEHVLFHFPIVSGGVAAQRPPGFTAETAYTYLVYAFVGLVLLMDWRLMKSKAGRAILAIRENEIAAASFGINVVMYKLFAFILSGAIAGLAGALFAHYVQQVSPESFTFNQGLLFVLITVVGGLASRAGIFVAGMFFVIFPLRFNEFVDIVLLVGPLLLLLTLTRFPGGIGQQLKPVTEWLNGKPFSLKHHGDAGVQSGGGGGRP